MGRRERKKMQSRRMILEAAVSEFSKNGYKDTSVADIMRTADLGIGTFYNYFTSNEDLLFSLLSRLGDAIRMALTEARAIADQHQDACLRIISNMDSLHNEDSELWCSFIP